MQCKPSTYAHDTKTYSGTFSEAVGNKRPYFFTRIVGNLYLRDATGLVFQSSLFVKALLRQWVRKTVFKSVLAYDILQHVAASNDGT